MLTKNDVFGEISLLEDTTRTATARAFEPSLILSITGERFRSLFGVFPNFEEIMSPLLRDRTANSLKQIPFFNDLDKKKRELVGEMLTFNSFPAGMTILKEGDLDNGLYFIMEGEIKVSSRDRFIDEDVHLGTIGPGAVFGELALLSGAKRSATLTSEGPCRLLKMAPRNTRSLLHVAPELMNSLIKIAKQHRQNSIKIIDHAADFIPPIDETVNSKLLLYSLLRNAPKNRHNSMSSSPKKMPNSPSFGPQSDINSGHFAPPSKVLLNTVEELKTEKMTLELEVSFVCVRVCVCISV